MLGLRAVLSFIVAILSFLFKPNILKKAGRVKILGSEKNTHLKKK